MEITISKGVLLTIKIILVVGLVSFITLIGLIIRAIIQVLSDTKNLEMYNGGDIIGVGDDIDTINSDTSTKRNRTTEKKTKKIELKLEDMASGEMISDNIKGLK